MRITHKLGTRTISKETHDETHFLLTNKKLGYAYFPNNLQPKRESRYMGVYFPFNDSLFKVVAELGLDRDVQVRKVINKFYNVKRHVTRNKEIFYMPADYISITYRLRRKEPVKIALDVRPSYEPFAFGRFYTLTVEGDKLLVEYTRRDQSTGEIEYQLYIAIKPEDLAYKEIMAWKPVYYALDFERNSPPAEMEVFQLATIDSKKIVISFSPSREDALNEADYIFDNLQGLERIQRKHISESITDEKLESKLIGKGSKRKEAYFAYNACKLSLDQLHTGDGIIAGLPWFFQIWSRDELISLKNLPSNEKKEILFKHLGDIMEDGRIPNIYSDFPISNADAVGWLFKRIGESLDLFPLEERKYIRDRLIESIARMNENYLRDGLLLNRSKETWMDTAFGDDGRIGRRIEIQAMLLYMYNLAYRLTKHEKTHEHFKVLEEETLQKVRDGFWNDMILADGVGDNIIRPNIFIAAYIYPKILGMEELTTCFLNSLPALWLSWGGLSTIDKGSSLFTKKHTGEKTESYHRGDSWYYLNNLAALVLYKNDKKKFKNYIGKILSASTEEILWSGMIGHHSEVSSACKRESQGCGNQAWSNAMYIELINEIYKK